MNFIELTRTNDDKTLINMDNVILMKTDGNSTLLQFHQISVTVKESIKDIMKKAYDLKMQMSLNGPVVAPLVAPELPKDSQ